MKPLRFVSKDKKLFSVALKKNVNNYFKENELSSKGNSHAAVKSVVMLSLYIVPFVLLLSIPVGSWLIFPVAIVMGIGMAGIGMSVMHDAAHGSLSRHGRLNRFLASTVYMLGGNVFTWKVQHNILHHTYTNVEGHDEDIQSKGVFRFSKHAPVKKIHRFQHIYALGFYSLMTITKFFRDFAQLHKYNKAGITREQKAEPRKEYTKMIISKSLYVLVVLGLPLLLITHSWWMILLGFIVMHLVAGMIMSVIFQMAHLVEGVDQPLPNEEGNIECEWLIHEMATTANFARKSRIMSWFIGGLNFQIEHHLFPNICHVHYRKLSPIVERTALEFGVPYNVKGNFVRAIFSHFRTLKALGRD